MTEKYKSDTLYIYSVDETYIFVDGGRSIVTELGAFFSYDDPKAKFKAAYKNKLWDGKYKLLDYQTQRMYKGLLPYIQKFCKDRDYECVIEKCLADELVANFSMDDGLKFIKSLNLIIEPYDYQVASFVHAIATKRATFKSPTSSGKSLIMYLILRYILSEMDDKKQILLTVPTVGLLAQMLKEFKVEYCPSFPIEDYVHLVSAGVEKTTSKPIIVTTWQSCYKNHARYFNNFEAVIIDEAHQAKSEAIKGILTKCTNVRYRYGFTGTLDGMQYNRLIIEGLTGPVFTTSTTKELMDRKITSELFIRCIVLNYSDEVKSQNKKFTYPDEVKFIANNKKRNNFVSKLALSCADSKANVLVLTATIDHIKALETQIKTLAPHKIVHVVQGSTDKDIRETVRVSTESSEGTIIIATYGVFSTGISIKNLQYIIFASGSKSVIRVLQSIGRGLRKDGKENKVTVIDIADSFGMGKATNYILRHFFERIKIYTSEKFSYKIKTINI